jgi:hypothetical protein
MLLSYLFQTSILATLDDDKGRSDLAYNSN